MIHHFVGRVSLYQTPVPGGGSNHVAVPGDMQGSQSTKARDSAVRDGLLRSNQAQRMLKGLALLLLFRLSSGEVGSPQPVLSGETTYERIPDVTADIDHLTEKITSNEIDSAADELEGYHKEFFEVSAKCGFMFGTRETTVGSVSWNAIKYEDISENIHLFAETCKSLGKDVPNFDSEWENYKGQHGKFYATPAEDSVRRELYFKRKADIDNHNARYREGLTSYSMKLNYFSDMRLEEMSQMVGCVPGSFGNHINISRVMYRPSNLTLPGTVDWRQKGVVSEVKDQGQCGSCWAFSTTGGIEGQWKIHKGRLLSLSEQQLVDCSHRRPNNGCHGGNVEVALTDIFYAGGIESEQSYPYESSDGQRRPCRFDRQKVVATVKGWVDVPSGNEGILQECVANHGPTSVMIHVSESFYHYHQGVFDDPPCVSTGNHAILVVGYGVQNGQEYWLIKNSWGTGWGYGGFGLMSRNKGNQCIIASFANSPVV